jgi:hypothetical protein
LWPVTCSAAADVDGGNSVSEMRPPTGPLFIPQVMHMDGEPWWSDIDRAKLLICPLELSSNPTSSDLGGRKWRRK